MAERVTNESGPSISEKVGSSSFSDLKTRVIVAVLGGALLIWLIWMPPGYSAFLFGVLALAGLWEGSLLIWKQKDENGAPEPRAFRVLCFVVSLLLAALVVVFPWASAVIAVAAICGLMYRRLASGVYLALIFAGFYSAYQVRAVIGFEALLLLFVVTWTTDTGAYFVGKSFGKNKMAPKLSPKKTWEGTVGGTAFSLFVGIVGAVLLELPVGVGFSYGLVAGTFGQAGDLVESSLKRGAGVKDSARYLPGHGGILDRFDSFIVNAGIAKAIF